MARSTIHQTNEYFGIDSFLYIICDNGILSLCDSGTVYIDITTNVESNPINEMDCEVFPNPSSAIFNIEILSGN